MVDSISVIGPGWRATNPSTGDLITDGVLAFFDAGTSNARTVYSDSSLSTSLGTTVDCNSGGMPVTSGDVRTLIYTGDSAYKIRLTSATYGGTVWEFDNVQGALDTDNFLTEAAVADESVVATSTNYSVDSDDKGKVINVNCSGGDVTVTLDDAATLGDGFFVTVRHDGTANQVIIVGDGTDTFGLPGVNAVRFALTGRGHSVKINCDATNFKVVSESPPFIGAAVGVILVADRLSTPPGSPQAGARYIVTSSPTGDWSGFSEHDIAEADGAGNWFNYTPPTDAGWIAYVQDEDINYQFRASAWVPYTATDTVAGIIEIANASEMEAASDLLRAVTPGRQLRHPGHPKAGGNLVGTGTPAFASGDYGMGAVTDHATGNFTLALDTAFNNTNYWANAWSRSDSSDPDITGIVSAPSDGTKTTSSFEVCTVSLNGGTRNTTDFSESGITFWGDYA